MARGQSMVTLAGLVAEAIYELEMQGGYSLPEASVEDMERLTAEASTARWHERDR